MFVFNVKLLKDDTAPSDGKSQSFWSLGYYQSFFDVDTNQVLRRILWSMIPNPKAIFLNAHIRPNPDLYGKKLNLFVIIKFTILLGFF